MPEAPHPRKEPMYPMPLTRENLEGVFARAADLTVRDFTAGGAEARLYAIDGLVASAEISDFVVKPLQQAEVPPDGETALRQVAPNCTGAVVTTLDDAALKLTNGFCLCLLSGGDAVAFEVRGGDKRGVSAPTVENTIKGAKDAFTETLRVNTALVRRHLRTPDLRLDEQIVGRRSLTRVAVLTIEGLTDPALTAAVRERLETVDVDGLSSPAAVEEYLTGSRKTAFPLLIYTERADRMVWGLLEGRVGVLVDGLPLGYLLPCGLTDFLASPEDRGESYPAASGRKLLRWVSLLTGLLLPGIFAAACLYHQEMIPMGLLLAIQESRASVPVGTGTEVLLLLVAFELLQEAGLQLPQNLGQAASIIGGLVVGTAAVEASLISPASLIAVAAAGICTFTLPRQDFADGVRLWRFFITLAGAAAGLAGVALTGALLVIHLADLRSLGESYLDPLDRGQLPGLRPPLWEKKHRPENLHPLNIRNQR